MQTVQTNNVSGKSSYTAAVSNVLLDESSEMKQEVLPFTIRVVENREDLMKVVNLRYEAYARHVPELANILKEPEVFDFEKDTAILIVESKLDNSTLGTMRIQTNRINPLKFESSVTLPWDLQGKSLSEADRLCVTASRMGRIVKVMLFKAYFQYCVQEGLEWMVITARAPIDKTYESLLFKDIYPDAEDKYVPMSASADVPHRVMKFHVPSAQALWEKNGHPLYEFVFETFHPDIMLGDANNELIMGDSVNSNQNYAIM